MSSVSANREGRKHARKEALYRVAVDLFRRQGYDDTRVEEITQAAGVSKGTFFNYFATKEEVLRYIGERQMSRLGATILGPETQSGTGHSGLAGLKRLLRALASSLWQDRDLVRMAVDKAMPLSYLADQEDRSRMAFAGLAAVFLTQAQRDRTIHPDLDADGLAQLLEGLYYQQLALWCSDGFAWDLGTRLEQVVDLLVMGIGYREDA